MNDRYEQWRREKASAEAPDGFADRVMAAAARHDEERAMVLLMLWRRVAASRTARVAGWSVATVVCLAKLAAPAAMILVP